MLVHRAIVANVVAAEYRGWLQSESRPLPLVLGSFALQRPSYSFWYIATVSLVLQTWAIFRRIVKEANVLLQLLVHYRLVYHRRRPYYSQREQILTGIITA